MSSSLEHTATAPSGGATSEPGIKLGTIVDHYVIEKELGSGGMGVVYAAFDTELQRRVALKVLRDGLSDQAQQRLLREARAMARLAHPHVVTVYEVGSANGRDFVAMELIDGAPLADWIREQPRSEREILDAFIDAGLGLAAAHAAGMVHRDFKPHNVLRSRGGRVVVTDFGLAREAADPLAVTQPVAPSPDRAPTERSNSALSDLTVPGALVGTPAYMAPEQWSGARITPATDQFAFCVALWEAFTGERPYRGPTLEELRDQVTAGPATLDASKVPRRLRGLLRRGLAADPDARWPSMDVLLGKLRRRSTRIVVAAIALAAIAGTVTVVALGRSSTPSKPSCRAPALALPITMDSMGWHNARGIACEMPVAVRENQLACLDLVAARIDAITRARALSPAKQIDPLMVDPMHCTLGRPLALPARYSDELVTALAMAAGGAVPPDRIDRARASTEPCVVGYLGLADSRLDDAGPAVAKCGDDLARADYELRLFERDALSLSEEDLAKRTRDVELAVELARGSILGWRIEAATAAANRAHERLDDAIVAYDAAIGHAPDQSRALELVVRKLDVLLERGRRLDVETAREQIAKWKPIAEQRKIGWIVEQLAWVDATAQWSLGDIEGGGKRLRELHAKNPAPMPGSKPMSGIVVDRKGVPVAGATVATGFAVIGDERSVVTPMHGANGNMRLVDITTTGADGKFVLEHAPPCFGVVVAEANGLRSRGIEAREGVRLVIEPTTHVRGRVDLAGRVGMFSVSVGHVENRFVGTAQIVGIVGPDGRFAIDGIVPGDVVIGIAERGRSMSGHGAMRRMRVGPRGLDDLVLEVPAGRELRVLLRGNDTLPQAPVFIVDGTFDATSMTELLRRVGEHQIATTLARGVIGAPPAEVAQRYASGDLLATFSSAPTGPATACALHRLAGCEDTMRVKCVAVPANAALVTLEVNRN